jgi:hypothetical protein
MHGIRIRKHKNCSTYIDTIGDTERNDLSSKDAKLIQKSCALLVLLHIVINTSAKIEKTKTSQESHAR